MKLVNQARPWFIAALLAIFVSACATTQDEMTVEGDTAGDQSSQAGSGDGSSGATAIAGDGASMTAMEKLEQTDGTLANRTIYFDFDSAKLSSESIEILEAHGNFIAESGEVSVVLEGHCDERGSREYNIGLGDRRAQSVRRVLLFQGSSADQIETVSYGEERPVALGHHEEAWKQNRRVELIYMVN